jgi:hypothetical protein
MIRNLVSIARDQDHMSIRHLISRIVPEYHMDTTLRDTDVRILRPVTGADKSEFGNILNAGHHLNGNGGKLAGY